MKENITAILLIVLGIIAFSACAKSNKFERDQNETVDAATATETGVDPDAMIVIDAADVGIDVSDGDNAVDAAIVSLDVAEVGNTFDVKTDPDADASIFADSDIGQDVIDTGQEVDAGEEVICNSTKPLTDDLYYLCYKDEKPCDGYQIRARLFLDLGCDLFSWKIDENGNLVLREIRDEKDFRCYGHCAGKAETGMTGIGFDFNYDEVFDESLLPGLRAELEWKVEIENAVIEYCESCYTMDGPGYIFWFRGSLNDVEFVKDTKDELEPYIEVRDTEGNLVADIR